MKFPQRNKEITLTQNQWASLSLTLFLALVVAVLVLPPWSPLSLTSQDTADSNREAGLAAAQPAGTANGSESNPAAESLGTGSAPAPTLTPPAALAATATPMPNPIPTLTPPISTPPTVADPPSSAAAEETPSGASLNITDASVEELILATEDPDWGVRWDAVNRLGELEDIRAVPALVRRALYDDNPHPQWRALWALSAVDREGVETIPLFLEALDDPEPVVVHNAALGLAFFDRPEARPALIESLKSPIAYRRWEAVFSLRNVGNDQVVAAILPLLDPLVEPDDGVRGEVVLALGRIALEQTTPDLLDALRNDISPKVRWRTTLSLGSSSDPSVLTELEQALSVEQDSQVREGIEDAIAQLRGT